MSPLCWVGFTDEVIFTCTRNNWFPLSTMKSYLQGLKGREAISPNSILFAKNKTSPILSMPQSIQFFDLRIDMGWTYSQPIINRNLERRIRYSVSSNKCSALLLKCLANTHGFSVRSKSNLVSRGLQCCLSTSCGRFLSFSYFNVILTRLFSNVLENFGSYRREGVANSSSLSFVCLLVIRAGLVLTMLRFGVNSFAFLLSLCGREIRGLIFLGIKWRF